MTARFLTSAAAAALLSLAAASQAVAAPATFFPQAEPSNQEQALLELINQARANPAAEGQRLANVSDPEILRYYSHYGVDKARLAAEFASYSAQPPLAFSPQLMASSRLHSQDMAARGFQSHDGSNGSHFDTRINAQGYQWRALGENVFAYAQNAAFGHAGLNADWGVPDLNHRANIMNTQAGFPVYKEVGIACAASSIPNFGPLVITQDFGAPADAQLAYVTGVVYNDANGNGAYDEGEGLGGVSITPDQGDYYTTTSASGGFALPLPRQDAGSLSVTASGGALGAAQVKSVRFANSQNVKLDFTAGAGAASSSSASLPQVSVSAPEAAATADGGQTGVIVIKRKGAKSRALEVALSISGSAAAGVDYSALPASVTIPAGASSVSLPVQALQSASGAKKIKVKAAPSAAYAVDASAKANVRILGR
jgi:uncharacterized protein YkwD